MFIFLVLAAPLWYIFIISLYKSPARGWWSILEPWIGGVFIGLVTLTVTLSLMPGLTFSIYGNRLFPWVWFRQSGWPLSVGIVIVCVIQKFKQSQISRLRELAGWFTGITFVYLFWKALVPDTGFEDYHNFYTPVFWIMETGIIIYILNVVLRIPGLTRFLCFAGTLFIPSLMSLLPMYYVKGHSIGTWLVTVIMLLIINLLILLDSRGSIGTRDGSF